MKILSLDSSGGAASAAVTEDEKLLAECYTNVKLTHSETLMPMVQNLLGSAKLALSDIDGYAVSAGPGSFTGVRIGVSALKGMAWAADKPCVAVSALEAMAECLSPFKGVIVASMDARCAQVYNALFYSDGSTVSRICDDRALYAAALADELIALALGEYKDCSFIFAGDGAKIAFDAASKLQNKIVAPEHLRYQRASGVAAAAVKRFEAGETVGAAEIMPSYLRLPQAERELKAKSQNKV